MVHAQSYYFLSLASPLLGIGFASGDGNTIMVHYYDCLLLKIHFQQIKLRKQKTFICYQKREKFGISEIRYFIFTTWKNSNMFFR